MTTCRRPTGSTSAACTCPSRKAARSRSAWPMTSPRGSRSCAVTAGCSCRPSPRPRRRPVAGRPPGDRRRGGEGRRPERGGGRAVRGGGARQDRAAGAGARHARRPAPGQVPRRGRPALVPARGDQRARGTAARIAAPLEQVFADVVVVRGDHPVPPRDMLEIRLPEAGPAGHGGADGRAGERRGARSTRSSAARRSPRPGSTRGRPPGRRPAAHGAGSAPASSLPSSSSTSSLVTNSSSSPAGQRVVRLRAR